MKQLLKVLLSLFAVFYIVQILFLFFGPGYETNYRLNDNGSVFTIDEKYQKNSLYQLSNYYITISLNNQSFDYQLVKTKNMGTRIINSIKYYSDSSYTCIWPIFKNSDVKYDITCLNNGNLFYYHDIKNKDSNLDLFVNNLKEYDINNFVNDEGQYNQTDNIFLYQNNTIKDYNLSLLSDRVVYCASYNYNFFNKINVFNDNTLRLDTNSIYTYINNYLVIADGTTSNNFTKIILINQDASSHQTIDTSDISSNSYIEGVVGNSVYLIDRNTKKQYEINADNKTSLIIGTEKSGIKYYNNGQWENRSFEDALKNNLIFTQIVNDVTNDFTGYDRVIKYGDNNIGYYYYFKINNGKYDVYSSSIKNPHQLTYLFTSSMDKIKYDGDYIYFIDNGLLKYYHHSKGLRTLVNMHSSIIDYNIYYN